MQSKFSLNNLPSELIRAISGYTWQPDELGYSSAHVFRLTAENKPALYLKIDSSDSQNSLYQEKLKLDWLKNRLPVPDVVLYTEDKDYRYLLSAEVCGLPASDDSLQDNISEIIKLLVTGLKLIHRLNIEDCQFNARLDYKIQCAKENMLKGLVNEDDFDEARLGRTAEDLFQELLATKPANEDLVFTHGDYCLPNIIIEDGKLSGFVDWGNAGVADRYQDIALLSRSIKYNFGTKWEDKIFRLYGIEPDWEKIHFYRLLDEFF